MLEWAFRKSLALFKRHFANVLFVLLALALLGWVSWEAGYVRMVTNDGHADYWEHSATLHALIENPWHPRHPHLATNEGSPRFGPQFIIVALIARAMHWNAIQAMTLAAVLNTLLFLAGIRLFFRSYFRHPFAPLYGLLVMFGGWWSGFYFSNVYALNVFFFVDSFPSTTALGLSLLGFALAVRVLRGEVRHPRLSLFVLGVWAGAVLIIHPLTAMLSISGVMLLAVAERHPPRRVRLQVAAVVIIGCALAHFWPYFSPWLVLRGGHGEAAGWAEQTVQQAGELQVKKKLHDFYRPIPLLKSLGLGTLTLLTLPYFLWRRPRWFVGLGVLGMLVPFVGNMFVELPLGHRFVLLAIVYMHIGVVWLLLKFTPGYRLAFRWLKNRYLAALSALLVAATLLVFCRQSLLLARKTVENRRYQPGRESWVIESTREIANAAGPGAVVLATPALSWPLPTFGPKVLVLFHQDPLVPDAQEREYWVRRFLTGLASDDERRTTLRRYGVTHVLLLREYGPVVEFLDKNATLRRIGSGYRLYKLDPSASRRAP